MDKSVPYMIFHGNLAENWRKWRQRFEIYSVATELNKKDEKVQCAQLLHQMGEEAISIFNTFNFMEVEKDKIEILKKKFEDYFVPKKNLMYERYKFFTFKQTTETIEQYATELKTKAAQCEFGQLKEELIKTMLITGIKDDPTREKLLQQDNITSEKAIECCIVTESARQQLKEMKNGFSQGHPTSTAEVEAIQNLRQVQAARPQGHKMSAGGSGQRRSRMCNEDNKQNHRWTNKKSKPR